MSSAKFALLSNSAVCMLNFLTPQFSYFIFNTNSIQLPPINKKFCILIHKLNTIVFSEMLLLKEYTFSQNLASSSALRGPLINQLWNQLMKFIKYIRTKGA